jgi:predicted RNA-binding Zn ribbon-like protein
MHSHIDKITQNRQLLATMAPKNIASWNLTKKEEKELEERVAEAQAKGKDGDEIRKTVRREIQTRKAQASLDRKAAKEAQAGAVAKLASSRSGQGPAAVRTKKGPSAGLPSAGTAASDQEDATNTDPLPHYLIIMSVRVWA